MAIWVLYNAMSVSALILCWQEWTFVRDIWRAAQLAGYKGVRRLMARTMSQEGSLRVVMTLTCLVMAACAMAQFAVYGPPARNATGFQWTSRAMLVLQPCLLLWKAISNGKVRRAFSDAALHSEEFADDLQSPYMVALWHGTPILVVDRDDGIIVDASEPAHALFGYPFPTLRGLNVDRLVPENLREKHAAHRRAYTSRPLPASMAAHFSGQRLDGSSVPLMIQLVPALGKSRVVALVSEVPA